MRILLPFASKGLRSEDPETSSGFPISERVPDHGTVMERLPPTASKNPQRRLKLVLYHLVGQVQFACSKANRIIN